MCFKVIIVADMQLVMCCLDLLLPVSILGDAVVNRFTRTTKNVHADVASLY